MLKVLVLEDEDYTLRFLEKLVSEHPQVLEVKAVSRGQEAVAAAGKWQPDIAFLDIELAPDDGINGIEVAKAISDISPNTKFVFITGYAKYAIDSFAVHPYDYVLKPIKINRVIDIISALAKDLKTAAAHEEEKKRLVIKAVEGIVFIDPEDIFLVEKYGKKTFIHCKSGIWEASCSFGELQEALPPRFLRVHKSYIVNMDKVCHVQDVGNQSYQVHFKDYDHTAIMSRSKFRKYQEKFTPSF